MDLGSSISHSKTEATSLRPITRTLGFLLKKNNCVVHVISGAGTNLKVGRGGTGPARSAGNFSFWSCHSTFLALKIKLVALVSALVMVSTSKYFVSLGNGSNHILGETEKRGLHPMPSG